MVAQILCKDKVIGSNPMHSIALLGNNLPDTGVQFALPPLYGGKLVIDRAEGLRTNLNNIRKFERIAVAV